MTTPQQKRPHRWRRRFLWLGAAVLGARLLLALCLPWLVDLGARQIGCSAEYRSASLSLLGLSLHVEDLTVRDREQPLAAPLLSIQELTADVSTWRLLHGEYVLVDAALSGARVQLRRTADGALVLPAALRPGATPPAPAATTAPAPAPFTLSTFELPFLIASARVHDLHVDCLDETTSPPRALAAILDLDASDLGRRDRSGHLTARVHSPGRLEQLRLVASTTATAAQASLQWQLAVQGLQLAPLQLPADLLQFTAGASAANGELGGSLTAARSGTSGEPFTVTAELQGAVLLDAKELLHLRGELGPATVAADRAGVPFQLELHGAELVDRLRVEGGRIDLSPAQIAGSAALDVRGITLGRLQPWLLAAGVTMPAGGADATARLQFDFDQRTAALAGSLENVTLRHGDERIALRRVAVAGLASGAQGLSVDSVTVHGPELDIARLADGTLAVAGLRLHLPAPATTGPAEAAPTAPAGPTPGFLLRRLTWRDASVRFRDATLPGHPAQNLAQLAVDAENLGLGSLATAGHVLATLRLPTSVESVRLEVDTRPRPDGIAADLRLAATDLSAQGLGPWLQAAGCQPEWRAADLSLAASVEVGFRPDLTLAGRVASVRLQEGEQVLLGLRNLELTGFRLPAELDDPNGLQLGALRIDEPRLHVQRGADGTLSFAGVRFGPGSTSPPAASSAAPSTTTRRWQAGKVVLQGARVFLQTGPDPATTVVLGADAELGAYRADGSPTTFTSTLHLDQAIDALELRGTFTAGAGRLQCDAQVDGRGLRGSGLTPWLPQGLVATLTDGSLRARLAAQVRRDGGATGVDLVLAELWLRDGDAELAAIDRLELHAPTLAAALWHVQSLQLQGLRAIATQTAEGLHLPGLLLQNRTPAADAPAVPMPPAAEPAAANAPRAPLPALRLDQCEIACQQFVFRDRRGPELAPFVLTGSVQLQQPWATTEPLVDSPPLALVVTVAAPPVCGQARAEVQLQPFHTAPWLDLSLRAEGLDPTALGRVSPALGERIGGTTDAATLTARLHASLDLHRRDPTRFDFGRPFGGHLQIDELALRDRNGGELASVAAIEVVARAIDPQRGDVLLKSIDIDSPVLHATRTAAGLELAGLLLRTPPAPNEPTVARRAPAANPAAGHRPEFAVDRLRIQGLRATVRDTTTTPPTELPIDELDLSVQQFSTELLHEPRPFAFQMTVRGGDLSLPRRVHRSSALAGLLGAATQAAIGGRDEHDLEPRPLFADLTATGQLQLYPLPKGNCRLDLTGFEMAAVRGLASQGGVVINDGTFDASVTADLAAGAGTKVKAGLTFTWLSMTEPPNGPISTYLKLPAPLESVLFLLRNDTDEQRLPLQLHLPVGGVNPARIAEAAIEALTLVIADSVRTSPFRLAGTVTGLLDFGQQGAAAVDQAAVLACTSGGAQPDLAPLAPLLASASADPDLKFVLVHELGAGDLQHAAVLGNPAPEVVRAAITRLRDQRLALADRRDQLAATAAASYAAARPEAPQDFARLQVAARELGELESTLDAALEQLDATSPRQQQRQARKAAQALAQLRLDLVRGAVASGLPADAADRIEVRTPRTLAAAGLTEGGRVVVTVRRRAPATDQRR